jgi:RNA polymerase primary sigma factor
MEDDRKDAGAQYQDEGPINIFDDEKERRELVRHDITRIYYRDISKIPLLSPEEERELGLRSMKGDKVAQQQLVSANLRLVVKMARQRMGRGLDLEDLINEGNIGLMRAAKRFVPDKARFTTYATWWIRQKMDRAIADTAHTVKRPYHMHYKIGKVRRAEARMTEVLGREPSVAELAVELDETPEFVLRILERSPIGKTVSSDEYEFIIQNASGDFQEDDDQGPDAHCDRRLKGAFVEHRISVLDPGVKDIIIRRFGLCGVDAEALETIALSYDLSRERIRQIESKSLDLIRGALRETGHDTASDFFDAPL